MERMKRAVSLLLCFVMVVGLLPMYAFAATTDESLSVALTEAKTYIDALTVNNSSNDPATVVAKFGTHFTWDNEKRENSKSYLYDWSYYNGVVFEGLEYLYEVTGEAAYKDYVVEYMSALITAEGDWATCSNNSSKTAAGYKADHGADCYKTASLLLDAYQMTGDSRYKTMAATLYADLDSAAANGFLLSNAGNNYRHTWASDPNPDLWLDGLYMILPFRAEYAKYIGDQEELDLIVSRLQWVSDNMCSDEGVFYHAADSASSNSGTYWLRSIGWYAAAIVDVMDSMEGENLEAMKAQLVKLVNGMLPYQRESGLWSNAVTGTVDSDANREETSGTALLSYAIMKAVNNGWLDESYAEYAVNAFVGICDNKLEGTTLKDICYIGTPGSANAKFYDNEGKGVGPFIMFTAEVQEYYDELTAVDPVNYVMVEGTTAYAVGDDLTFTGLYAMTEGLDKIDLIDENGYPIEGVTINGTYDMNTVGTYSITATYEGKTSNSYMFTVGEPESLHTAENVTISGCSVGIYDVTASVNTEASGVAAKATGADESVTYSLSGIFKSIGFKATVVMNVPENWRDGIVTVYHVDGEKYTKYEDLDSDPATYTFVTNHFSDWEQTYTAVPTAEGDDTTNSTTGYLKGGTVYTLKASGEIDTTKTYLIMPGTSEGSSDALTNNNGTVDETTVEIIGNTITVEDDTNIAWTLSGSDGSYTIGNNGKYLYPERYSLTLNDDSTALTVSGPSNGAFQIYRYSNWYYYYPRYSAQEWSATRTRQTNQVGTVYLYEWTSTSSGEEVIFTLDQSSVTMQPEGQMSLTGNVVVGDTTYDLSQCEIDWSSDKSGTASVITNSGTVTAVANGTATITATLNSVNGTALAAPISLYVSVNVQSRSIDPDVDPVVTTKTVYTKVGQEPDFSGIKVQVTYTDGETGDLTVGNGLTVTGYDIENAGKYYATLKGTDGTDYGTFLVVVEIDYSEYEDATTYPEYPADGAVRINKDTDDDIHDFQTSGITRVELDVAGISVKTGVDVILVVDVSNSMGWSLENAGNSSDSDRIADAGQINKLQIAMESAAAFADILLKDNTGEAVTDNTLSFVTFAGYDATFGVDSRDSSVVDSLLEVFRRETSADDAKVSFEGTTFETGISTYHLTVTDNNGDTVVDGTNRGDTNYDYAFWQALQTANTIKTYNTENNLGNREIYVVFMTDGAPSHYNHNNKSGTGGRNDRWPNDLGTYQVANSYTTNQTTWYNYFSSSANTYAKELYTAIDGNIMAVGFDLAHGGFTVNGTLWQWTEEQLTASLAQVAHDDKEIEVYATADAEELKAIYEKLATGIKYAGTSAQVNDIIDSDFTLQMSSSIDYVDLNSGLPGTYTLETAPTISVIAYDLYTKDDTDDTNLIGTRKGTKTVIEEVTFSADGTQAFSNLKGANVNIMTINSDGSILIDAEKFDYVKTTDGKEYFDWNIGNITDKEIALAFDVYLKDSLDGGAPAGAYYTNEEATLDYIDINDKHAHKVFPRPGVGWQEAITTYEFYLTNDQGQPVNRAGEVIPFANRIIVAGPVSEGVNKYLDENNFYAIDADVVIPAGYVLLDESAYYKFKADVDALTLQIGGLGTVDVLNGNSTLYNTHVAFAVTAEPNFKSFILEEDVVVIDYGKQLPVDIIANNNTDEAIAAHENYKVTQIVGFAAYSSAFDPKTFYATLEDATYSTEFTTVNGKYTISSDKVIFTPSRFISEPDKVLALVKLVNSINDQDILYMYNPVTVIPATIVYYETDFAGGVFTYSDNWEAKKEDGTSADGPQDDGTIGQNTYGYDSTYANDAELSNGTSEFAKGQGYDSKKNPLTYVTFSFTGTGFDLISRTGAVQGLIKVEVFSDAAMTKAEKTVSVLNKSESGLELYQIPVVSINDLTYGVHYVRVGVDQSYTYTGTIEALKALNRGNEFYFDAIRIYDPAKGNSVAEAAYSSDGEANANIAEVRAQLLDSETYATVTDKTTGMVYVDRTQTDVEIGDQSQVMYDYSVETYATIGPNNEVYLSKNQGIAFKIQTGSVPASVDIGAKTIYGSTAGLNVFIVKAGTTSAAWTVSKNIQSSTAQYIDLLNATDADKNLFSEGVYVVITNTSEGVLSITDIKVAYSGVSTVETLAVNDPYGLSAMNTTANDPYAVSYTVDANTLSVAKAVLIGSDNAEEPEVTDPEEEKPNYDILDASVKSTGSMKNRKYTITVVTSQDVKDIDVFQGEAELKPSKISFKDKKKDGTRVWTIVLSFGVSERYDSFTLVGIGQDGTEGEPFVVSKSR